MISEVKWKVPGLFKADPNKVHLELQTLEEVTPDAIVELAENKDSVLHNLFEWDDKVAAGKWRKQQARIIMCNLVIEETKDEDSEPTLVRLYHKADDHTEYHELSFFVQHEDEYEKLLKQAKRDLESFKTKYHILKELKNIFELIDEL